MDLFVVILLGHPGNRSLLYLIFYLEFIKYSLIICSIELRRWSNFVNLRINFIRILVST